MIESIAGWLSNNYIELLGAVIGLLYIGYSIKQSILTWPTGLLASLLYALVFYQSKLYADMALQVYYFVISIYGWLYWAYGNKASNERKIPIKRTSRRLWLKLSLSSGVIYVVILFILKFTDSDIAHLDAMTTALSIVATWMLARKYIEHWLIWIFVDLFSAGMYVYKNLWPTVVLFLVYTFMAYIGYREWNKESRVYLEKTT